MNKRTAEQFSDRGDIGGWHEAKTREKSYENAIHTLCWTYAVEEEELVHELLVEQSRLGVVPPEHSKEAEQLAFSASMKLEYERGFNEAKGLVMMVRDRDGTNSYLALNDVITTLTNWQRRNHVRKCECEGTGLCLVHDVTT